MEGISKTDIDAAKRVFAAIDSDKNILKDLRKDKEFDPLFSLLRKNTQKKQKMNKKPDKKKNMLQRIEYDEKKSYHYSVSS